MPEVNRVYNRSKYKLTVLSRRSVFTKNEAALTNSHLFQVLITYVSEADKLYYSDDSDGNPITNDFNCFFLPIKPEVQGYQV